MWSFSLKISYYTVLTLLLVMLWGDTIPMCWDEVRWMTEVGITMSCEASTDFVTIYQKDDHLLCVILDHRAMMISKVGCQEQTLSTVRDPW